MAAAGEVRAVLEEYARRGVFRSFDAAGGRFTFRWLWNARFTVAVRPRALVFEDLLPEPPEEVAATVRTFLAECVSSSRPAHRRADPRRVQLTWSRRYGLRLRRLEAGFEEATRLALNLVSELFTHVLAARHPGYLAAHFGAGDE